MVVKKRLMMDDNWIMLNIKALCTISLCLVDIVLFNVEENIAKALWEKLGK